MRNKKGIYGDEEFHTRLIPIPNIDIGHTNSRFEVSRFIDPRRLKSPLKNGVVEIIAAERKEKEKKGGKRINECKVNVWKEGTKLIKGHHCLCSHPWAHLTKPSCPM